MKAQQGYTPPRIISIRPNIDGVDIAAKEDVLWPFHMFSVAIPARPKSLLNIFEQTVLKLSAVETSYSEKLAHLTGLDIEVIYFIQQRLVELELLTERFDVTDFGKKWLEKENSQDTDKEQQIVSATVFVDLLQGNVMPIVIEKIPPYTKVLSNHKGDITFEVGSAGKPFKLKASQLLEDDKYLNKSVTSADVVQAIKRFKKLQQRFALLVGHTSSQDDEPAEFLPQAQAITVTETPQLVYMACKIILPEGTDKLCISDPFGYGFSSKLVEGLMDIDDKKLIGIKQKARDRKLNKSINRSRIQLSGFNSYIDSLPKIKNKVSKIEDSWDECFKKPQNDNQIKTQKNCISKVIKALYDALELAFAQIVLQHPNSNLLECSKARSQRQNEQALRLIVEKLNIALSDKHQFRLSRGKINAVERGSVEIQPLLAVCLIAANENNRHPLWFLAENKPHFILFINRLRYWRNQAAHGQEMDIAKLITGDKPLLAEFRQQSYDIIKSLFPRLTDTTKDTAQASVILDDEIDQQLLDANIVLERYFGIADCQIMLPELKQRLLDSQLYFANYKDLEQEQGSNQNHNEFVLALSSALEVSLFDSARENLGDSGELSTVQIKQNVLNKALNAGFTLPNYQLPESLATAGDRLLRRAMQGSKESLATNCIAFFVSQNSDVLQNMAKTMPEFLIVIDKVAKLRGHSNQELYLNNNERVALKSQVWQIVKLLIGS